MRTLLLFVVESAQNSFDGDILKSIGEEQKRHQTMYRTDVVRVCIGNRNCLNADDLSWEVCVNEDGGFGDETVTGREARQLTTKLVSRMSESKDGCETVFFGSGDGKTELVALHLGQLITKLMLEITAVNTHLVLLQDQMVYQDPDTMRLIGTIRRLNQQKNHFYTSMNLLPWEGSAREATRRTACMLVKSIVMGGGHAMGVAGALHGDEWIETAAVTRLTPPVPQITHKVFRYLADDFNQNVLVPALGAADGLAMQINDLKDCIQEIKSSLQELERRNALPSLEELYMIMPAANPTIIVKQNADVPVSGAWDQIYNIYGEHAGRELYERMYPNMDRLKAEYEEKKRDITVLLLRKVLEVGAKRSAHGAGCGFEYLPDIIENIKKQVLSRLKGSGAAMPEERFNFLARLGFPSDAVKWACTRHTLLKVVYKHARDNYNDQVAEMRAKMFSDAADEAKLYLSDCIVEFKMLFERMCSMRDAAQPAQEYFSYRMDEAYNYWCNRKLADKVGLAELYNCFTEEVCRMPYKEAAKKICDQMEMLIDSRTSAATNLIKVRINSFFTELKYRAELLQSNDGKPDDLDSKLLEHLKSQLKHPPLMMRINAELNPSSRMFIFHKGVDAQNFANLIAQDRAGASILDDPFEDGIMMIVKYEGNALKDTIVAVNNTSEDAQEREN